MHYVIASYLTKINASRAVGIIVSLAVDVVAVDRSKVQFLQQISCEPCQSFRMGEVYARSHRVAL